MKRNNRSLDEKQKNLKKRKYNNKYTNISKITENIYLGNKIVAKDITKLDELGITHIVNCADELEYIVNSYDNTMDWLWLPMIDCKETGIVNKYIDISVKYIDDAIKNNNKVLVHCAAGISRSSSIIIAYLMYKNKMSFDNAFEYVKNKRSCCNPNKAFREQLQDFDFALI